MTDAQLSILIHQYHARLTAVINEAEAMLPDHLEVALNILRTFAEDLENDAEQLDMTAKAQDKYIAKHLNELIAGKGVR